MILENIILAASAAKAWSQYFDGLLNGTVHKYTETCKNKMQEVCEQTKISLKGL
jgi:phosphotransacetylase